MNKNKLFIIPKPLPDARLRLFLFPYAGGSISTYIHWAKLFSDDLNIELVLIHLPGRGARTGEPAHQSMELLVSELLFHATYITSRPYILFGHSLGARVAYELTCKLAKLSLPSPKYLIASGSGAPHLPSNTEPIHDLPQDEFVNRLEQLNGTPREILSNSELLEFLIPLLRADFKIAADYQAEPSTIACPIMVLGGDDDIDISIDELNAWSELSEDKTTLHFIPGDHFFINANEDRVVEKIMIAVDEIYSLSTV